MGKKKFNSPKKQKLREKVWPNLQWQRFFVHGLVREKEELKLIMGLGITLVSFHTVLNYLNLGKGFTGASGTDISEIIHYFGSQEK